MLPRLYVSLHSGYGSDDEKKMREHQLLRYSSTKNVCGAFIVFHKDYLALGEVVQQEQMHGRWTS